MQRRGQQGKPNAGGDGPIIERDGRTEVLQQLRRGERLGAFLDLEGDLDDHVLELLVAPRHRQGLGVEAGVPRRHVRRARLVGRWVNGLVGRSVVGYQAQRGLNSLLIRACSEIE